MKPRRPKLIVIAEPKAVSVALPAYRYRDPAEVLEHDEETEMRREARLELQRAERESHLREDRADLRARDADALSRLSEPTRLLVKRARIRELVDRALGRGDVTTSAREDIEAAFAPVIQRMRRKR